MEPSVDQWTRDQGMGGEKRTGPNTTQQLPPAAERMRVTRQRRRDGLRIIPFEIRDDEIEGLVTHGLLDPVARNDRNAIARAVGGLLDVGPPRRWPTATAR